jgi:hypothetical protein
MPKHERALSYFPSFYDAPSSSSLLYHVARALGEPMEHADTLLYRIQRAHRLRVVEELGDLVLLAGALDLSATHFDDILSEAPPSGDAASLQDYLDAYAERVSAARRRMERVARLHLIGLGTVWAVMEGAAIFMNAEVVAPDGASSPIRDEDDEGFSHRIDLRFERAVSAPKTRIVLHENPLRRRKPEPVEVHPLTSWPLKNDAVQAARTLIVIEGAADRTVLPSVFCTATGEGITFYGIVPDGARLVVDSAGGATLAGKPVDEYVSFDVGARFDVAATLDPYSGATGRFVREHDGPRPPFDGDLSRLFTLPRQGREQTPEIPVGPSTWEFAVAIGVCDRSDADFAVFEAPLEPIGDHDGVVGFDAAVFDFPASGRVAIGWDERIPCAFKLLVPPRIAQPGVDDQGHARWTNTDIARMSAMVDRFRPAGVRAYVDVAKDSWTLGESVLRSATVTSGDGVERDAACVRSPGADRYIPLDPSSLNA